MRIAERLGLPLMRRLDPELAHGLSIRALETGLMGGAGPVTSDRLKVRLAGMDLTNPVGLAAGFDKNAQVIGPLSRAGFGFIEVGAATPLPQDGNPRPRLFRLTEDRAAINRFGFNNQGAEAIAARLEAARAAQAPGPRVPVGLNLGANKDSDDRAGDFGRVLRACGAHVDFATVNVSSPNTERLRDLQGAEALAALLDQVQAVRDGMDRRVPLFVKIAPDLGDAELADVSRIALRLNMDGIIATNTTLDRTGLRSAHRDERGGLSGAPLFEKSTRVLARLSQLTEGAIPLIGVGGVSTAEQALAKIRAGASAVQLYTAMVYGGLSLARDIATGLDRLLDAQGYGSVAEAVGTGREEWLI